MAEPRLLDRLTAFVRTLLLSLFALAVVAWIPLLAVGDVPSDSTVTTAGKVVVVAGAYGVTVWLHSAGERRA